MDRPGKVIVLMDDEAVTVRSHNRRTLQTRTETRVYRYRNRASNLSNCVDSEERIEGGGAAPAWQIYPSARKSRSRGYSNCLTSKILMTQLVLMAPIVLTTKFEDRYE